MAIKGLTDRPAAFPILGVLRKGEKKPNEHQPGKDLTYFRFETTDMLAAQMFSNAYPDEDSLRNINFFLPHKTADENMDSWIELWIASGLIYRSDGETMVLWRNSKGGYDTTPKPDPRPEIGENGKRVDGSMQVGRLSVIVPELGRFATVTVLTTSKHDIINMTKQLRSYEALRGDLRGIPFTLKRRPCKISTPAGNGKRARREKWLLSIETQPEWTMAQLTAMERAALPEIIDAPALDKPMVYELPDGITSPYDEVIEDEFEGEQSEPQPTNSKQFSTFDALLFQLHLDFGLKEDSAKAIIKTLGFNGLPTNESARRQRLAEIYAVVKSDVESRKATEPVTVIQDGFGLDVPPPPAKNAVKAGL